MFGLACGYVGGNDAARIGNDPVFKLLADRGPIKGPALGSQPTLSQFENAIGNAELLRLSEGLADAVIQRHRRRKRRVRRITIDLDPSCDPTHGKQQLSLFNGLYDRWCYLPLTGFLTFDNEVEQYLFCYMLPMARPAQSKAVWGC